MDGRCINQIANVKGRQKCKSGNNRVLTRLVANGVFSWAGNKEEKRTGEDMINAYGQEGWELVSVASILLEYNRGLGSATSHLQYFFRRPLP